MSLMPVLYTARYQADSNARNPTLQAIDSAPFIPNSALCRRSLPPETPEQLTRHP
jgi:hypothetical protein